MPSSSAKSKRGTASSMLTLSVSEIASNSSRDATVVRDIVRDADGTTRISEREQSTTTTRQTEKRRTAKRKVQELTALAAGTDLLDKLSTSVNGRRLYASMTSLLEAWRNRKTVPPNVSLGVGPDEMERAMTDYDGAPFVYMSWLDIVASGNHVGIDDVATICLYKMVWHAAMSTIAKDDPAVSAMYADMRETALEITSYDDGVAQMRLSTIADDTLKLYFALHGVDALLLLTWPCPRSRLLLSTSLKCRSREALDDDDGDC